MKNLYIIGARGCGRETYNLYLECKDHLPEVKCAGFLDDKLDALDNYTGYPPIISSVEDYLPKENDVFICALGDPKWVNHYTSIIKRKNGEFISLISPHAYIGSNTIIGEGCHIARWSIISCDCKIGKHCYIGAFSDIGHDVQIDDDCHLGAYTFIGGNALIQDNVTIHPRVNILPGKKIESESVVGAGSVVIRNVKKGTTVFGNPAKVIS